MANSADPQGIMAAMAQALQESRAAHRPLPARALTEADRVAAVQAVIYAEPSGPDAQGFLAIGELQDQLWDRTGLVLLHSATNSVRLTWVNARRSDDRAGHGADEAEQDDAGASLGRYAWARALLAARGIQPPAQGFSKAQLLGELERRGWHWDVEPGEVRASKFPTASPTIRHEVVATGASLLEDLTMVLAGAIDYDETGADGDWTRS